MAKCRVYLFTYNRNHLLPRAVRSLLNQTHTDWTCEVHNDNPLDPFPKQYIAALNDGRFLVANHSENMGAVRSFNIAFKGCGEPYASILEDDNWWEPDFLAEMIATMEANKTIHVAWSNMRLWKEEKDNSWTDTGETVWPEREGAMSFSWPQQRQAIGAMHSNGAMIFRSAAADNYIVPDNALFNAVELIRERAFEHPIWLNYKPLANFSITLETNRSNNALFWTGTQVMLFASFVIAAHAPEKTFSNSIAGFRSHRLNTIAIAFLANLLLIKRPGYYRFLNLSDWLIIGRWLLRNGTKIPALKQYLRSQNNLYTYLLKNTLLRYKTPQS